MRKPIPLTASRSTVSRWVTAVFGLFLLAIALAIALSADSPMRIGPLLATIVLAALGLEALVSAIMDRRSLVARIGPLP